MRFDWTVNIGNLIPIASLMGIIIWRMSKMETKVDTMWRFFISDTNFGGRRNYFRNSKSQ